MTDSTASRKLDHLRAFDQDPAVDRRGQVDSPFDAIRLIHRALPELDFEAIDTSTEFLRYRLSMPFLISSMTGGADAETLSINRNLAQAAEACQVAMAVGSQRVMFSHESARRSFALRELAPSVPLIANLGAVQLNKGFGLKETQAALEILQADAIYFHLNPLQEAIQPEGDRNFAGLIDKLSNLRDALKQPMILKEVGCGFSAPDLALLAERGFRYLDVAGRGGTSWSRIEHHRQGDSGNRLGLLFQDWGLDTVTSLRLARQHLPQAHLIASGGLRHGVDLAKSVIIGAQIGAMAAPLLSSAQQSTDACVGKINEIKQELKVCMFLLGTRKIAQLHNNSHLILEN
jgi:isopentenyl-diphosphate delta-isomerase